MTGASEIVFCVSDEQWTRIKVRRITEGTKDFAGKTVSVLILAPWTPAITVLREGHSESSLTELNSASRWGEFLIIFHATML